MTSGKLRLGLCCIFCNEPIKFRHITAKTLRLLPKDEKITRLSDICLHNALSLKKSIQYVNKNRIGAFRILSPLFPLYTHPEIQYRLEDLPAAELIENKLTEIRKFKQTNDIRLSFHPDQFNVLSSPREDVIRNTMRELEYQGMLADRVDADVINVHAGGVYGNKKTAMERLQKNVERLPGSVTSRLTLENDDTSYSPADLLPLCKRLNITMVYDVHHHRCLPDGLSEEEVTEQTVRLWQDLGREPYFHISSPKNGWENNSPKPHADYIDPADFPSCWTRLTATVDIEAKAKELAVLKLQKNLKLI
jgi:UV DNA damage endonuclease